MGEFKPGWNKCPQEIVDSLIEARKNTDRTVPELAKQFGLSKRRAYEYLARAGVKENEQARDRKLALHRERNRDFGAKMAKNEKRIMKTLLVRKDDRYREWARSKMLELWQRDDFIEIQKKRGRDLGKSKVGITALVERKLGWCPPEYRDLHKSLVKKKGLKAIEAMRIVIRQMEHDQKMRDRRELERSIEKRKARMAELGFGHETKEDKPS